MSIRPPEGLRAGPTVPRPLRGRVVVERVEGRTLRGNPWNDPTERDLAIYLPPSGESEGRPLLIDLAGYAGSGPAHFQRSAYLNESLVALVDRLIATGASGEAVLAGPDCLTSLGGSQYVDSSATGAYASYVVHEVLPFIEKKYRTGPVGIFGSSSGGFGAIWLGLHYPERFRAIGADVPDALFEYSFLGEFPGAYRTLRAAGGVEPFLRTTLEQPPSGFGPGHPAASAMLVLALSACYSPAPDVPGAFDLPFDLETGELRPDVWARWLAFDPVRYLASAEGTAALQRVGYLFGSAGSRDEYAQDLGIRLIVARARKEGVPAQLSISEGGHFDKAPRLSAMLPEMVRALREGPP